MLPADERFRSVESNCFFFERLIIHLIFILADCCLFNFRLKNSSLLELHFYRKNCIISETDLSDFVDSTHLSFLHFIYSRLNSAIVIVMIGFWARYSLQVPCFCSNLGLDPSLRKSGIFCFYYLLLFYILLIK